MLVSLLLSTVNRGEGRGSKRTDVRRVGGAPRFSELVGDFWKEGGRALVGGLLAPREKPLVQPAARRLLRQRPASPSSLTAFAITQTSSVLGLALREEDGGKRVGSVTEHENSYASALSKPLVLFYSTARTNGCAVSLRD